MVMLCMERIRTSVVSTHAVKPPQSAPCCCSQEILRAFRAGSRPHLWAWWMQELECSSQQRFQEQSKSIINIPSPSRSPPKSLLGQPKILTSFHNIMFWTYWYCTQMLSPCNTSSWRSHVSCYSSYTLVWHHFSTFPLTFPNTTRSQEQKVRKKFFWHQNCSSKSICDCWKEKWLKFPDGALVADHHIYFHFSMYYLILLHTSFHNTKGAFYKWEKAVKNARGKSKGRLNLQLHV